MACRRIGNAIVCTRTRWSKRCTARGCGNSAPLLCDFPIGAGKTCDAAICAKHACLVGADLHHCPEHASAPAPAGLL
jgi:hypothetical protein